MRCALCGGEIDSSTGKCQKCGECWNGGNRGIAQQVSYVSESAPSEFRPPSVAENLLDRARKMISAADTTVTNCIGRVTASLNIRSTRRQNRIIACSFIAFILTAVIIISVVCCTVSEQHELCGRWTSADSSGAVIMEFTRDGNAHVYILSGGTEKLYRSGNYSVENNLLTLRYSDGETITLMYSTNKDTAVFTLLSTGESQTYIRK